MISCGLSSSSVYTYLPSIYKLNLDGLSEGKAKNQMQTMTAPIIMICFFLFPSF